MFERFTTAARQVVVQSQAEAAELRHGYVGTEHLLLAMLADPTEPAASLLVAKGLDHDTVLVAIGAGVGRDTEALAAIGVDLDAVREAVEAEFGAGALDEVREEPRKRGWFKSDHRPFTPRSKKVLELSLREALRLGDNHIAVRHLLLGLLREGGGLGAKVMVDRGVDLGGLRQELEGLSS